MQQAIVSHEIPANYERLKLKFGVSWDDNIIVAYDGRIHCKLVPMPQKIVHEMVHIERQKLIGNDAWWTLYFDSEEFRRDEELLAYKAEADFIKRYVKDKNYRFHAINDIASSFSGVTYGNIITKQEALKLLL